MINQVSRPRDGIWFFFFLLAHCGGMSERSKESPAEIGYLSIYVYAYILGMTRNAARLIENINDFSRFFSRTNDTYASGYWYVAQDTWQLDVSAKNVCGGTYLSCARLPICTSDAPFRSSNGSFVPSIDPEAGWNERIFLPFHATVWNTSQWKYPPNFLFSLSCPSSTCFPPSCYKT